jgi:hypothetical protein
LLIGLASYPCNAGYPASKRVFLSHCVIHDKDINSVLNKLDGSHYSFKYPMGEKASSEEKQRTNAYYSDDLSSRLPMCAAVFCKIIAITKNTA